ncbi:glycosyltransferase family 4 protein [Merismopedia glauca]|uniref:Mannosyltransferase n=1 Tax=Merismopedia glauca CCAP 1448/3 TaxID=1296344 RepID=A0A2T1C785_9CYAN|nr:glycosyltransferase family 1 protein [Merismopedia glauca]PSB04145.1 mannosyltransferase [Merismopedia glauca CCAP 1448/3]
MSHLLVNLSFLLSQPTGISTYALNLLDSLHKLQPTLLSPHFWEGFQHYTIPSNLTPEQGSKGHLQRLIWTQFELPQIYQNLQANLLFSPVPEAPIYTNCRYIVTVHDLIPLRFPRFSPLTYYSRYYIPTILNRAECIICNSQATAKDITDFYHINPHKIAPILLAYDRSHFYPLNLPKNSINRPYFLYLGRQDSYKNIHRLIAAFATLPNCQDYELWIAGSTDKRYTPALKKQIVELEIVEQVKFLEYVPYEELPKLINQALAFVFPSLWEGFGLPVLEAMGCGTPVITSNISSLPEVAGDAGILVNPYSVEEIADGMKAVAEDGQLRSHLSQAGIIRASHFSWSKTGAETVEVLKRFL